MSFLPDDYLEQSTNKYMKLQDGDNSFRVLSSAIVGQEYWTTKDKKRMPMRVDIKATIPLGELEHNDAGELVMPKVFWAFVVWNFADEVVQILEITQISIRKAIKSLVDNPKWGDPKTYTINVNRTGKKFDTVYTVTPDPKEELDPGIVELYKNMDIKLEALMTNDDPFKSSSKNDTVEIAEEVFEGLSKGSK